MVGCVHVTDACNVPGKVTTLMSLPSFILLGAAKAGTTVLWEHLKAHPDIFMCPVKEPNFFAMEGKRAAFAGPGDDAAINRHCVTDLDSYSQLYSEAGKAQACGEASNLYLYSPDAPATVRHYVPDAKLLVVLRNPADRAYSSFLHLRRDEREPFTRFRDALAHEAERVSANWEHLWHYRRMGLYSEQLTRYFDLFDRAQMHIYLYEDLLESPGDVLRSIFTLLEVDPAHEPDLSLRTSATGLPRNRWVHRVLWPLIDQPSILKSLAKRLTSERVRRMISYKVKVKNIRKPEFPPDVRRELTAYFREDVLRLQTMIGRDLSAWLAP